MKRAFTVISVLVLFLAIFITYNTANFRSRQISVAPVDRIDLSEAEIATRLSGALKFRTVAARNEEEIPAPEFYGLHQYLADTYPATHQALIKEIVADYSLLYKWKGTNESLAPIVLMAHMDVVPAPAEKWEYPPFSGMIADGYVWGRGALDDKSNLIAILEAAEMLTTEGKRPERTVLLAFGHDEEVSGKGAEATAKLLEARGVRPNLVFDEGLSITQGVVPDMVRPVASVGIAEKGYLTIELMVRSKGGHSSVPPPHTAIGILSRAIQQLEEAPFPSELSGVSFQTIEYLGPELPLSRRVVLANLWLTKPLVESAISDTPHGNAMLRTTTAVTMIQGGIKENVLPLAAKATVNFRIRPGQTVEDVKEHVAGIVDPTRIEITIPRNGSNPSPVSSTASPPFEMLSRTIRQVFPHAVVAPGLLMGATDSRYYANLTTNIYRFSPFVLTTDDIDRFHAANERISIASYGDMIRFYVQLLQNTAF